MRRNEVWWGRLSRRRACLGIAPIAALAIIVTLTGCSSTQSCTAVGLAPNGVNVQVKGAGLAQLAGAVFEVCTPRTCTSITRGAADDEPTTGVSNSGINSTKAVAVSVTVRDVHGRVIVPTSRLTVVPIKAQPNGPDCAPTGYSATAVVTSTA